MQENQPLVGFVQVYSDGLLHLVPFNDIIEHTTEGCKCGCQVVNKHLGTYDPRFTFRSERPVSRYVLNKAIDGREQLLQALQAPLGEALEMKRDYFEYLKEITKKFDLTAKDNLNLRLRVEEVFVAQFNYN